jgi:hypothetical protein
LVQKQETRLWPRSALFALTRMKDEAEFLRGGQQVRQAEGSSKSLTDSPMASLSVITRELARVKVRR